MGGGRGEKWNFLTDWNNIFLTTNLTPPRLWLGMNWGRELGIHGLDLLMFMAVCVCFDVPTNVQK